MAKGKLWEVSVLYHPKPKRNNAGEDITEPTVIVMKPEFMLAATEKEVGIRVSRLIPKEYDDKIEDVEVSIRPF